MLTWMAARSRPSEVGRFRLWHWILFYIDEIFLEGVVVFRADRFKHRSAIDPPAHRARPRLIERTGIVDGNRRFQSLAVIDEPEPLHDVHIFGVRRAPIVHEVEFLFVEKTDGVHDQLAVLVMANRFPEPGRFRIDRMRHVQIDAAHLLLALPNDPNLLQSLDEVDGLSREKQLAWRTAGPAAGLGGESAGAVQHILIVPAHQLLGPRLKI